ncbi:MAG TPA: MerR family transcriptional regulator [Mesorhizobium sp.]|jgi:DNA-binding transcriptional MerR regulator|uniref:MerR family transcriptional regulator n=1 Tax=Mesorhizobium sp. TaxID=1871066 RepID=UPI002DDD9766|nr:MerR family transcriptional regulator [Mesorhizobium sp.]HEV2504753.1 MerR family transcriptional regulator [Mesorhizobium sp.]
MTRSHLLAGRFGAATRLSPKALRLYAEHGLLVPAHVDPQTGYRYYAAEQAPRARLIARLRQLGLPMARIAGLLELSPQARAIELRTWLEAQNERLFDHAELVEAMARHAGAATPPLAIALREVAATKVVSRRRSVSVVDLDGYMAEAQADIRAHLTASGLAHDGPMSVHHHDLTTRDNEGPVEVAIACAGPIEPADDLLIRLLPARREAFVPIPAGHENFPLELCVYDALEAWIDRQGLIAIDSPCEIYPGSDGADFDIAYPVNS